jgi:hypothetical protein
MTEEAPHSRSSWPKWDIFIAHSSEDKAIAAGLFHSPEISTVTRFLDAEDIPVGSYWDEVLQKAQSDSLMTVALISNSSRRSPFTREEIHTAIKMTRRDPGRHKLIPVYLEDMPAQPEDFLYGLSLIQGVLLKKTGGVDGLAKLVTRLVTEMKAGAAEMPFVAATPSHILHEYPLGPLVEPNLIKRTIIDTYARLIPLAESLMVVNEANNFRLEADPGTPYLIRLHMIQAPATVAAFTFWMEVFDYARLQGPRMLAALLLVVPADMWDERARSDRLDLLNNLHTIHH